MLSSTCLGEESAEAIINSASNLFTIGHDALMVDSMLQLINNIVKLKFGEWVNNTRKGNENVASSIDTGTVTYFQAIQLPAVVTSLDTGLTKMNGDTLCKGRQQQ